MRLGKAIPASVDMPSLIVQLDRAAEGTGIHFTKIATGEREACGGPGRDARAEHRLERLGHPGGGRRRDRVRALRHGRGVGQQRAGHGQPERGQRRAVGRGPDRHADFHRRRRPGRGRDRRGRHRRRDDHPGLETVPLELEFVGDFFDLADFFHDVKRFVRVANQNVLVGGRLITVEGVQWASDAELFPQLKATIKATVYLAPKAEGTTAGATPRAPRTEPTTPAGTSAADSGSSPVPTATATP